MFLPNARVPSLYPRFRSHNSECPEDTPLSSHQGTYSLTYRTGPLTVDMGFVALIH